MLPAWSMCTSGSPTSRCGSVGTLGDHVTPAVPVDGKREAPEALARGPLGAGGHWDATPTTWHRYDRPRDPSDPAPMDTRLIGTLQVAYGTPTKYEITVYRATITRLGTDAGWTVESLCDEAL